MQQNTARRASIMLGVFMAIVLVAGALLPLLNPTPTTVPTVEPTQAATATLPAPITDFTNITFDKVYLHPSGVFAISQPPGWESSNPTQSGGQAQVNFINSEALSVIDVYVEEGIFTPILPEELSARFNDDVLAASWANFSNWDETNRRMEDERLLIDFVVTLQGQQYVARQIVTTDGEWIYVTRVLAPNNATALISYLMENLPGQFVPFKQFKDTPFQWMSYFDSTYNHIIRFPQEWSVSDSAPGRPASILGTLGERLRVEGFPNTSVANEAAARAWVQSVRGGATILSVEPTTRDMSNGFAVSYSFADADGEPQSGLAVLLNGVDGVLHTANLYFPANNVDLNTITTLQEEAIAAREAAASAVDAAEVTPEATGDVADAFSSLGDLAPAETESQQDRLLVNYATVMSVFGLLPQLNLSDDSLPPATPTPLPTPVPAEAEAASTSEATGEAGIEAEATPEATTSP